MTNTDFVRLLVKLAELFNHLNLMSLYVTEKLLGNMHKVLYEGSRTQAVVTTTCHETQEKACLPTLKLYFVEAASP